MIRFSFQNFDYDNLRYLLEDGLCHVFSSCKLPRCFNKRYARIGFEKDYASYILYIDKGLICSDIHQGLLVKDWLQNGELRFLDFNDLKEFLCSLSNLF